MVVIQRQRVIQSWSIQRSFKVERWVIVEDCSSIDKALDEKLNCATRHVVEIGEWSREEKKVTYSTASMTLNQNLSIIQIDKAYKRLVVGTSFKVRYFFNLILRKPA
jgi:hypothetical protein